MVKVKRTKTAIFGATGYVGLIMANRLVQTGKPLKLFVRNRRRLNYLQEYNNLESCDIELIEESIDLLSLELEDVEVIYYFIHSMTQYSQNFEGTDCQLARIVSTAAFRAGVQQIIYLGGLGVEEEGFPLSTHLRSRQETGNVLRSSGVSVTEIRAGVIIGAGSASYEIIRALGTKLLFIPKLPFNRGVCQPIDIDDVIAYLLLARLNPEYMDKIIEVGIDRNLRYDEMIQIFARNIKQKNLPIIPLLGFEYFITPSIVARIIAFFSAIPYSLALPLVEGLKSKATKKAYDVKKILSHPISCIAYEESIAKASNHEEEGRVESFWSIPIKLQVLTKTKERFLYVDHYEKNGLLFEKRVRDVATQDVDAIFTEVTKIGGDHGYWSPQWLWSSRAFIDKLMGGPGIQSDRRIKKRKLRVGERIDFWTVSDFLDEENKKVLTLKGRIRSPGNSWLQFALIKATDEQWKFMVRAYFEPHGILGYLYWYSLFFPHKYIFTKMINTIIEEALKSQSS